MTVLPVVAREMGVLARRKSTYWSRWVTAVLALLVMLWLLLVSSARLSFAELGASIFLILSSLCFIFSVLVGVQATSDCLSEEKREGTLGLLFLTDLKGFDVIGGKLAASSLNAIMALIGVIPMLSLALLLGGVTLRQFGLVALVLANTMFLSLAVGVFISSLSKNERKAMVGTFVGLFIVVLGPFIFRALTYQYFGYFEELIAMSPLYAFIAAHAEPSGMVRPIAFFGLIMAGPGSYLWHSLAGTHLLGWLLLIFSAWVLPRCVNELPAVRFRAIRAFVDNFVYGRLEQRRKHRAELLDRNAFLWLASRERVKPKYAWGVVIFFVALYFWIAFQFDNMFFDLTVSAAVMFLIHLVFKIWAASEVCSRLIQDRRGGALELLLSTPLSVKAIAEGQTKALMRIFLKPIVLLLALELMILIGGVRRFGGNSADRYLIYSVAISSFIIDLWALKWVGLWLSISGKSIERVLLTTLARVLLLPWILFALVGGPMGGAFLFYRQEIESNIIVKLWWFVSVVVSLAFGVSARKKFLAQFRDLASKRFEAAAEPEPKKVAGKESKKERFIVEIFRQRPVASSFVTLLALLVLIAFGRNEYWSYKVDRQVKAAEAAGYPVSMSGAARYAPPPVASDNAFASIENTGGPNWRGNFGLPQRFRVNGKPATREEMKELQRGQAAALVNGNRAQLAALLKFPDYQRAHVDPLGANVGMTQYYLSSYVALLDAELILAREESPPNPERIEKGLRAMLALARLLRSQPYTVAQHPAGDCLRRLLERLGDFSELDILTEGQLTKLQNDITKMDNPTVLEKTLALQRAFLVETPQSHHQFGMIMMARAPGTVAMNSIHGMAGTDKKEMAWLLGEYEKNLKLVNEPATKRLEAMHWMDSARAEHVWMRKYTGLPFAHQFFGSITDAVWTDAAFMTQLNLLKAAIAAKHYKKHHGKYPATLAALVPVYLSEVPMDPYDDSPLMTVERDGALLIYSKGMDREDNTAKVQIKRTGTDVVISVR